MKRRKPASPRISVPQFGRAVIALEAIWVGAFLLNVFLTQVYGQSPSGEGHFVDAFALHPPVTVWQDAWWQMATYLFVHQSLALLIINCLALWILGSHLEHELGSGKFVGFLLACAVAAAGGSLSVSLAIDSLTGLAADPTISGGLGAVLGIAAAFAIMRGRKAVTLTPLLALRGWELAAVAGGLALALTLIMSDGAISAAVLSGQMLGGVAGACIVLARPRVTAFIVWRQHVLHQRESTRQRETRKKVDALLEKVHGVGLDGLTKKERTFLRSASKLYRKETGRHLKR